MGVRIDGQGFLAVQTPGGVRYTRNGALQVNATGQLVTSDGYQVMGDGGPIALQPTDHQVSISRDGTISVREGASNADAARGHLRVVTFANPQQLQKYGSSSFTAIQGAQPQPAQDAGIIQGSIEQSNVRSVVEMSRMIEITRTYTQIAGLIQQGSDQRRNAIDKLAEVPA